MTLYFSEEGKDFIADTAIPFIGQNGSYRLRVQMNVIPIPKKQKGLDDMDR